MTNDALLSVYRESVLQTDCNVVHASVLCTRLISGENLSTSMRVQAVLGPLASNATVSGFELFPPNYRGDSEVLTTGLHFLVRLESHNYGGRIVILIIIIHQFVFENEYQ